MAPRKGTARREDGAIAHVETQAHWEALDQWGYFTFEVPRDATTWAGGTSVAWLRDRDGDSFAELGTATPALGGSTGMRKLRYERVFAISPPIPSNELTQEIVDARLRGKLSMRILSGGHLPPATWSATQRAFLAVRPNHASEFSRLVSLVGERPTSLAGRALEIAAHERDAVGLALDFAGFDRTALSEALPDSEATFLQRLGEVRAMEDPAIAYDSVRFLDFDADDSPSGIVRLQNGDEELVVLNVNRQKLENTLGADLIYIHEQRDSIVMVQYKTMHAELAGRSAFRGDENLAKELDAMRQVDPGESNETTASFRLGNDHAFVKLCASKVDMRKRTTGPISGFYLPLGYLDSLLLGNTDEGRGPQGGLALNQWTVDRYLNNTLFAELVRGGWVGTRGLGTAQLKNTILETLDAGRSATIAVHSSKRPRGPQPRRRLSSGS